MLTQAQTFLQQSSSTVNAALEAARKAKSPIIIQVSNGGGQFVVGKSIKDANAAVAGSVALAMHVRSVAKYYGIPVVLHSDHCAKKLLPWFDGMLQADEEFFHKFGGELGYVLGHSSKSVEPTNPSALLSRTSLLVPYARSFRRE